MEAELADVRVEVRDLEAAVPEHVAEARREELARERQLAAAQASLAADDAGGTGTTSSSGGGGGGGGFESLAYHNPHAATTFRVIYFGLNAFFLALVCTTPHSDLYYKDPRGIARPDAGADPAQWASLLGCCALSWLTYLCVQGSEPGFLDDPDTAQSPEQRQVMTAAMVHHEFRSDDYDGPETEQMHREQAEQRAQRRHAAAAAAGGGGGGGAAGAVPLGFGQLEGVFRDGLAAQHAGAAAAAAAAGGQGTQSAQGGMAEQQPGGLSDDEEEEEGLGGLGGARARAGSGEDLLAWVDFPPMRAGYCRDAGRWVATYDHFCPFLHTPIGERNHARFWWFLAAQTLAICEGIGMAASGFHYDASWWSANGHAVAAIVLLSIALLFVGALLLFHTFLCLSSMTSREFMRSEEVSGGLDLPRRRATYLY